MLNSTAMRIANAVRRIEGLTIPGKAGLFPPGMDFSFKAWLWYDNATGTRVWYWAVCEIHPNITVSPIHIAGRIWEMDEVPMDVPFQNWTAVGTDSGYIFLDNSNPIIPVFTFLSDVVLLATGLPEDFIPIARIAVDGTLCTLFQIQYGDIFLSSSVSVAPVKLTSKLADDLYIGDVYEDGTDVAATETGASIYVREIAAGETLRLNITFSASRQKWAGVYYWTLLEVPRAL